MVDKAVQSRVRVMATVLSSADESSFERVGNSSAVTAAE